MRSGQKFDLLLMALIEDVRRFIGFEIITGECEGLNLTVHWMAFGQGYNEWKHDTLIKEHQSRMKKLEDDLARIAAEKKAEAMAQKRVTTLDLGPGWNEYAKAMIEKESWLYGKHY